MTMINPREKLALDILSEMLALTDKKQSQLQLSASQWDSLSDAPTVLSSNTYT